MRASLLLSLLAASGAGPTAGQDRSWMFGPFEKPTQGNPVITPNPASTFRSPISDSIVRWEEYATFNPAAIVRGGRVYVLYRAEDATGEMRIGHHTSRIGLAESTDGLRFARRSAPVLYPDKDEQAGHEWPGGVEDPRIIETDDGTYVLTYTQWNRDIPRLAIATSRDLVTWRKHGPAFANVAGDKYRNVESKSGAILSRVEGNRVIATRVNGTYWMYFNVPDILIATSDNLVDWTPLEDGQGRPLKVLSPRPGYFDSWLVEAGPPAIITEHGILVLYNAGNSATHGAPGLPPRVYTGGQALYDLRNPVKLIARSDEPFIRPTEAYERTGQYAQGTTFVEGLVPFNGRWFLYYGTADSRVGVAVWDPSRRAGGQGRRAVAFTFDDLPATRIPTLADAQAITTKLLGHIRAQRIPATGFVNETKLDDVPGEDSARAALLVAWLDAGLDLGNHTYSHARLYDTPLEDFQADVLRGERVTRRLMAARGRRPRYFRHPTLNTGPDTATKSAFERFLAVHGYTIAPVTIDNDEYIYALAYDRARARGDTSLLRRLGADYVRYLGEVFAFYERSSAALLDREPAQVLLLHANALNADYLGVVAEMLGRRGYAFVSLDEALRDPAYRLRDDYVGPRGPSWLDRWARTQGRDPGEPTPVPPWVRSAAR